MHVVGFNYTKRSEKFMAVTTETVFRAVMSCRCVVGVRYFGETWCLQIHIKTEVGDSRSPETSVNLRYYKSSQLTRPLSNLIISW